MRPDDSEGRIGHYGSRGCKFESCRAHPSDAFQTCTMLRWGRFARWASYYDAAAEIGPGRVLAKLTERIVKDPLPIVDKPAPALAEPSARSRARLVFMYGGQGTQYHLMGKQLYDTDPSFRHAMDRCSAAHQAAGGHSLIDAVYDPTGRGKAFDDVLTSHPALYCIGYSLTETLREQGIRPDLVLGHSLGEYIAATVAGVMTFEDGLHLVMRQARLLDEHRPGGMLSVLAPPALYRARGDLFQGVSLAGVNFEGNFVVSGETGELARVQAALDSEGVIVVRLPVRQGFHSPQLEGMRADVVALARTIPLRHPRLPLYSSTYASSVDPSTPERRDSYLWDIIRQRVRFDELIASEFSTPDRYFFLDLSASGSFANFIKHGYGPAFRCAPAINQFGNNVASMKKLREEVVALQ